MLRAAPLRPVGIGRAGISRERKGRQAGWLPRETAKRQRAAGSHCSERRPAQIAHSKGRDGRAMVRSSPSNEAENPVKSLLSIRKEGSRQGGIDRYNGHKMPI